MRDGRLLLALAALLGAVAPGRGEPAPAGGEPLVAGDALRVFAPVAARSGMDFATVDAAGPGFARAWRVGTTVDLVRGDAIDIEAPVTRALAAGDAGLVRFFARALRTTDESGTGRVQVKIRPNGPGEPVFETRVSFGRDWQEFELPFEAAHPLPAGGGLVSFGFGFMRQLVEVGGVEILTYGGSRSRDTLPRTRFTYAGRAPGAPWRREARARIEAIRKGAVRIRVVDAAGRPVPGAQVHLEETRAEFQWGSALQFARLVTDSPDNEVYRRKAIELFNAASPENDLKWVTWVGDWGPAYSRAQSLAGLRWLRDYGFHARGHVLVWPGKRNLPKAVQELLGTPRQAEIPGLVDAHIREMAAATQGLVEEWDTLNEPHTNHDLMDLFGPGVMADWFRTAHAAMPGVRLYLNDFSNHDLTTDAAHVMDFERTVAELQAEHAPLGGLGLQAHIDEQPNAPEEVLKVLGRYDRFHLPIRVTEFDVQTADEELQADYTRDFLILMFSHPAVIGVQVWGFWEKAHWRPSAAMYRADWSEKPNGAVYRRLVLGEWRTRLEAAADAAGQLAARGFYGDYLVRASAGGRQGAARFSLAAGAAAPTVTVTLAP